MQLSDMSEAHTGLHTPPSTNTWIAWTSVAHYASITQFSFYNLKHFPLIGYSLIHTW